MNEKHLTLGSLFDGSGGFPLAGLNHNIKPVWASEIEPFPIRVTHKHFPDMKHLGDIRTINGAEIEPVDIITFGSPCTSLSTAGAKTGIHGEQSNLFFEAIRIVKEMREATNGEYPKWLLWENVYGALTLHGGDDYYEVIKAFCSIAGYGDSIPRPEKWRNAGAIMGDNFSLGWRLLDAQYWGVPQRRRRIFLVCALNSGGGFAAREIFHESDDV